MNIHKILSFGTITKLATGAACGMLIWLQACVDDPEVKVLYDDNQRMIVDVMRGDTSLSLAVEALEKVNFANTINTYGPFTFFAPNNQAFKKYLAKEGKKTISELDTDKLRSVVQYHIINKKRKATEFIEGTFPDSTVNGDYYQMDLSGGFTKAIINGQATVYEAGLEYSNGIVHKIDAVLDPPVNTLWGYLENTPNLSILKKGMELAGLQDTLNTIRSINRRRVYELPGAPAKKRTQLTLFAVTNDLFTAEGITEATFTAMAATPAGVAELRRLMGYHVMPGAPYSTSYLPTTDYRSLGVGPREKYQTHEYDQWRVYRGAGPNVGFLDAKMLPTLTHNAYIFYDKLAANKLNNKANIKNNQKDIFIKNGLVQYVDNLLLTKSGATLNTPSLDSFRRIPIVHEFEDRWWAYGAAVNSNSPRVFGPERASVYRQSSTFAFMVADSGGDSMVTVIPGVQSGKYRIELSWKNGGNRATITTAIEGVATAGGNLNMNVSPTYEQRRVIGATDGNRDAVNANITSYTFAKPGDKRFSLRANANSDNPPKYEMAPDVIVLFPLP